MYVYPPTPAFTKAGAAPGTTAGVEPVFAGLPLPCRSPAPTMPKTLRGSFDQALRPLPSVVKGAQSRLAPDYSAKDRPAREKELGLLLCFVSETKSKNELMHDHHDECWFLMRRSITGNDSLFFFLSPLSRMRVHDDLISSASARAESNHHLTVVMIYFDDGLMSMAQNLHI